MLNVQGKVTKIKNICTPCGSTLAASSLHYNHIILINVISTDIKHYIRILTDLNLEEGFETFYRFE